MSPGVRKTPQAFADLDAIATFIGRDNPLAAIRLLELLESKFQVLVASPGIGRLRPELAEDLRAFPVDNYLIFYRQAGIGIDIIRVLHGARDLEALFHPSTAEEFQQ